MKNDLVVVVGAGASIPCGIPETQELTPIATEALVNCIQAHATSFGANAALLSDGTALAESLVGALRETYGERFNFELLIHALRWLNDYVSAIGETISFAKTMIPVGYPGPGTVFTSPKKWVEPLTKIPALWQAHFDIVKAIHTTIGRHVYEPRSDNEVMARERIAAFIRRLGEDFRLVVVDLNYDSLVDDVGLEWVDGFGDTSLSGEYSIFNPKRLWSALDGDRHVLLHVHGSIFFGYPATNDDVRLTSMWEPVKYADHRLASRRLTWRGSRETMIAGEDQGIFVLLSGLEKASNLAYNARPYGHYYLAAMTRLLRAQHLLVMGYGGNDPHVNEWIAEHARQRVPNGRAILISPDFVSWGQTPGRGEYVAARAIFGKEKWDRGSTLLQGQWRMNVGKLGPLSLFNMYLPDACDHVEEMIDLLHV